MKLLNILDAGHRTNSKDCHLNNENLINKHWNQWQFQLYNQCVNINDNKYLNLVQYKIKDFNKSELKKLRKDLIFFYSVSNSEITKLSNLNIYIFNKHY